MPAFPGKTVPDIAGTLIMLGSHSRLLSALLGFADICALPWDAIFSELPLYL